VKAVSTFETSAYFNETTRRSTAQGSNLHTHWRKNLKSRYMYIVTYVRSPWLNNVSTAITMDSTKLLHFLSKPTMETETFQCYMLHFLSNTTEAETFRLLWRGVLKESWDELVSSCARELVELGQLLVWDLKRVDAPIVFGALLIWELYSRTSRGCTCVRIQEELLTLINSRVLNFECNKVPL
jgi:hypothetical protein